MIGREEAIRFMEEGLHCKYIEQGLLQDPLSSLNKIIEEFHKVVPFQNITLLMQDAGDRGVPSLQQVKEDVLQLRGGLCYTNNVFMKHLLQAVGFTTYHIAGVCNPKHPNNHIATVVCDIPLPGDKLLVDVGCGSPTYRAVGLPTGTQESPSYHSLYLTFKLQKCVDHYVRFHAKLGDSPCTTALAASHTNLSWHRYYDFWETPKDLASFHKSMTEIYTQRFTKKLRVLRFYSEKMIALKENEDQTVSKLTFTKSDVTTECLCSKDDIIHNVSLLLPSLKLSDIETAVNNWFAMSIRPK